MVGHNSTVSGGAEIGQKPAHCEMLEFLGCLPVLYACHAVGDGLRRIPLCISKPLEDKGRALWVCCPRGLLFEVTVHEAVSHVHEKATVLIGSGGEGDGL